MTKTKANGEAIRRLREAQGLSGRDLADRAQIDYKLLSKIEVGALDGSPKTRLSIAQALHTELSEITYSVPRRHRSRQSAA